jgi:hypothetical protein
MKRNMGLPDRITRMALATIAPILYVSGFISGTLAVVLLIITAILIATSLFQFCPLYYPLGINKKLKH